MAVKDPLADFLNTLAEEIKSKYPQPGDITIGSFMDYMRKKGQVLTDDQAAYWLERKVKEGKLTRRMGIVSGKKGRIYSKT